MKIERVLFTVITALIVNPFGRTADIPEGESWQIPADKENFHVFILMGQSNMSGYGEILPEDRIPVPHVVMVPTIGELEWKPASHPLHNRIKSDRFGLGLPFAQAYLKERPGVTVGLIPVAWGGAAIDRLIKGTSTYEDAVKKIEFASKQGVIKGVLWHQGESNAKRKKHADPYEAKLHQLIDDIREDTGIQDLPFIVGNLAEFYGTGEDHNDPAYVLRIDQIRGILRKLPEQVPHTGFVESTGAASHDHHMVHFDRRSYMLLGERYASVYDQVVSQPQDKQGEGKEQHEK